MPISASGTTTAAAVAWRRMRRQPRLGHLSLRPIVIALAIVVTACAGEQPSTDAEPSTALSSAPSAETAVPTPTPTANGGNGAEVPASNPIAWILSLGPGAPAGPPEFEAYALVLNRDCAGLAQGLAPDGNLRALNDDAIRLYDGLANACLAAFNGEAARWPAAENAFNGLAPPSSCLDLAAYGLLGRLITAHQTNPSGEFQAVTDPASAAAPPCPSITHLEPNHGPSGTQVLVTGTNLNHALDVVISFEDGDGDTFSNSVAVDQLLSPEALTVTVVDDTNVALWACIVIQGAPGWNGAGALFVIDDSPAAQPLPSGGVAPTPTAACPPPSNQ